MLVRNKQTSKAFIFQNIRAEVIWKKNLQNNLGDSYLNQIIQFFVNRSSSLKIKNTLPFPKRDYFFLNYFKN